MIISFPFVPSHPPMPAKALILPNEFVLLPHLCGSIINRVHLHGHRYRLFTSVQAIYQWRSHPRKWLLHPLQSTKATEEEVTPGTLVCDRIQFWVWVQKPDHVQNTALLLYLCVPISMILELGGGDIDILFHCGSF